MAQLRRSYPEFEKRDTMILVVGPEKRTQFHAYWQTHDLPFVGLPDPDHHVANLYGQQVRLFKLGRMPALVVIDKQGRMHFEHHGDSMRDIPSNEWLLRRLDDMNGT